MIPLMFTTGAAAIVAAAIVSLVADFLVGSKSLLTLRSWWLARLKMTLAGMIGGSITYLVGFVPRT